MGECHIARAFTLTLVKDFEIKSSSLSITSCIPGRSFSVLSNLKPSTSPAGVMAIRNLGKLQQQKKVIP